MSQQTTNVSRIKRNKKLLSLLLCALLHIQASRLTHIFRHHTSTQNANKNIVPVNPVKEGLLVYVVPSTNTLWGDLNTRDDSMSSVSPLPTVNSDALAKMLVESSAIVGKQQVSPVLQRTVVALQQYIKFHEKQKKQLLSVVKILENAGKLHRVERSLLFLCSLELESVYFLLLNI